MTIKDVCSNFGWSSLTAIGPLLQTPCHCLTCWLYHSYQIISLSLWRSFISLRSLAILTIAVLRYYCFWYIRIIFQLIRFTYRSCSDCLLGWNIQLKFIFSSSPGICYTVVLTCLHCKRALVLKTYPAVMKPKYHPILFGLVAGCNKNRTHAGLSQG